MKVNFVLSLLFGAALLATAGRAQAAPPAEETAAAPKPLIDPSGPTVFDFESSLLPWRAGAETGEVALVSGKPLGRYGQVARISMGNALSATLRLPARMDLARIRAVRFDAMLPASSANMHLALCIVDTDEWWRQTWQRITLPPAAWTTLEVDLRPEAGAFESVGHTRPWGPYVARETQEVQLRAFADKPVNGFVYLDNIAFVPAVTAQPPQEISEFETTVGSVPRYGKFEISFDLSRYYDNPFNPEQVAVYGFFKTPGGDTVAVPGFFYQGYERTINRKVERLVPAGAPKWKIRYCPREPGEYSYWVEVRDGETLRTSAAKFTCVPSSDPGFLRVSQADRLCFEFDDGSFFYPIGHNIAASFNLKGSQKLGTVLERFEGTYAYDRFLAGMAGVGENFGRVWLSSWAFGLEWSRRYDHAYRDLGRYNLENAWRLDYVLDQARKSGIYVQTALTTFGHFCAEQEGDWEYSPYNVRNGGQLRRPQQFWRDVASQVNYQHMVRYAAARWGYSTNVAAWEICNEIDLASGYAENKPAIVEWHRACAATLQRCDPNRHMVTTSFASFSRDPAIISLSAISYSSTNWYAPQIIEVMVKKIFPEKVRFGKPFIMTEVGCDFNGATPELTERYLHLCLWSTYMIPYAGAGMPWWWDFLDQRNLYDRFRPLVQFAAGEDRRGRALRMADGRTTDQSGDDVKELKVMCLRNNDSGYFWIYERRLLRGESEQLFTAAPRENVRLEIADLKSGSYRVEFWNTSRGGMVSELTAEAKDGKLQVAVPTFTGDIAGKVKPAATERR